MLITKRDILTLRGGRTIRIRYNDKSYSFMEWVWFLRKYGYTIKDYDEMDKGKTKICSGCSELKPVSEFDRSGISTSGEQYRRAYCKRCRQKERTGGKYEWAQMTAIA